MGPAEAAASGSPWVLKADPSGWLGWLLAWFSFWPLALLRAGQLSESDTFWQIRAGQLTLDLGAIPRVDNLSWTAAGEPWTLNSWAFNVLLAGVHQLGGLPAVALLGAALAAVAVGAVLLLARRLGASPVTSAVVVALATAVLIGWLSVRPQLIDYLAVPVLVLLLRRIATAPRPLPAVVGALGLTLVWVNLHAAGLLGTGVAAAAGLVLLVPAASRRRGWLLLGTAVGMAALTLATPYGPGIYEQATTVRGASAGLVLEWTAINVTDLSQVVMLLAGVGAIVVAVRAREPVLVAALAVTAVAGLFAIRFLPILLLLAIPALALAASRRPILDYLWSRRAVTIPAAIVWVLVAGWLAAPALGHLGRPDPARYSPVAIEAIPAGCRVVNSYDVGGYLVLLRPDVLDSIDSRNDLFGADRVLANTDLLAATGEEAGGLAGAGCALLPLDSGLAGRLANDPAWRQSARDQVQVLFVRA